MIENCKLISAQTTLEFDREHTDDYVLDTVDLGTQETNYSLLNVLDLVGLERDIWYNTLNTLTITGYVLHGKEGDESGLARRKMRLNRFAVPLANLRYTSLDLVSRMRTTIDLKVTQSIRYGLNLFL